MFSRFPTRFPPRRTAPAAGRSRLFRAVALGATLLLAQVIPPVAAPAAAQSGKAQKGKRSSTSWLRHRVLPGERLNEIAARYAVTVREILHWNKLDPKKPLYRDGDRLLVRARIFPPERERVLHTVVKGDSWSKIAKKYGVEPSNLRRWNRNRMRRLRLGEDVEVWTEPRPVDPAAAGEGAATPLPIVRVRGNAFSVGRPGRGRLSNGVQLPRNDELYAIRNPNNSWGSTHAVETLQLAIARFRRDTGYDRRILICDMSRKRGGRFRPHVSHQSGRDVDIRLPLRRGVKPGTLPRRINQVDWNATWQLIQAFISTGQVQYIFLSRSRQGALHRAARRAGATNEQLERIIQFPRREKCAVVRHDAGGHTKHMHVRFKCSKYEDNCIN
jgi:murein endopeptidase/LysM repeat protein